MKPNHTLTLAMVCCVTFNAVCCSALGDYAGAFWALVCALLFIFSAKDQETIHEALTLAKEANAGWAEANKLRGDLIDKLDRVAAGQYTRL
jgi:hypothetical protein